MEGTRHQFFLPADDQEYLDHTFPGWEAVEGRWVLLHDFPIRFGFNVRNATAAIQIPPSYPVTPLDMVFFHPAVLRSDGVAIGATECTELIDGKTFQRWSRHYLPGSWHPNEDNLATHVLAIRDWLDRAAPSEVPA